MTAWRNSQIAIFFGVLLRVRSRWAPSWRASSNGSVQHRHQLRDQHQLAGLQRRIDAELFRPDGRPYGAELRIGRSRHRRAVAMVRGFARHQTEDHRQLLGGPDARDGVCAAADSLVAALLLCSQGVIQNFHPYTTVTTVEGATQTIAQGPVASQEAIKMLGTNGGGFFNANSAHPFENPTPFTNFLQMFLIFVIPAGLTYTFGRWWEIPARLGDLRGHGGHVPHRGLRLLWLRAGREPHPGQTGPAERRHRRPSRRQHGGQGNPLRHRELGACSPPSPPTPVAAPSTACTTASRRSAAWSPVQHDDRRGDLRRRRRGPVRHAAVLPSSRSSSPG
jgi:hypothetical protein